MGTRPRLDIPYPLHGRVQAYGEEADLNMAAAYNELIALGMDMVDEERVREVAAERGVSREAVAREAFEAGLDALEE